MKLTPTQSRMMDVLSDGLPHRPDELVACLYDSEMGSVECVQTHLSILRGLLRPQGEDVLCELVLNSTFYRHVRLLGSAVSGYR